LGLMRNANKQNTPTNNKR